MNNIQDTYIVIPARLESKRFAGKVLKEISGKPILQHVWEVAARAFPAARIFISTDSPTILNVANNFGAQTFQNNRPANNGTERVAEFAEHHTAKFYLNIQADDPGVTEQLIMSQLAERGPETYVSTPVFSGQDRNTYSDSSTPKVVIGKDQSAIYFSRSPIPHDRDSTEAPQHLGHVGMYLYSREALRDYLEAGVSKLEEIEKLEQIRFLWMGKRVQTFKTNYVPKPIDKPEDLDFWRLQVNE